MVTKLEILELYNAENQTSYTLQTLAISLLNNTLREFYRMYLHKQVVIPVLE